MISMELRKEHSETQTRMITL